MNNEQKADSGASSPTFGNNHVVGSTVNEVNDLIISFDGWKFIKWCGIEDEEKLPLYQRFENDVVVHPGIFHYPIYDEWVSIMRVIEKLENLSLVFTISKNTVMVSSIEGNLIFHGNVILDKSKLDTTIQAVAAAIKFLQ